MTFQQLEYIVEISKCGSINKASQKLFLSQSGISTEFTTYSDDHPSGIMFKSLTPGGDPDIFYMRKGAAVRAVAWDRRRHVH